MVVAEVRASALALGPLTPDATGRESLRAWVAREADIYHRYGPVFNAFGAAAAGIEAVAELGRRASQQNIALIRSRLDAAAPAQSASRELNAVIALLLGCLARTFQLAGVLRSAAPKAYPRARVEEALTDVLHRSLFGRDDTVNVRASTRGSAPRIAFSTPTREILRRETSDSTAPTLETLLDAGRDVFVSRGYAGSRIDDIVAAAGVSHGTFYQYFKNKNDLARVLVLDAMRPLASAFAGMPEITGMAANPADSAALRRWLRVYNARHVDEAAMIRVWVDAQSQGATLGGDAAPAIDWGRRRVAKFLRPRGFGDVDAEAVVMVALLDAFGSQVRSSRILDAATHIVQRGLLGL